MKVSTVQSPLAREPHGTDRYVSVSIASHSGRYYGTLCAISAWGTDTEAALLRALFKHYANIIGQQLDDECRHQWQQNLLLDERASRERHEQALATLGHELRNPLQAILVTAAVLGRTGNEAEAGMLTTRIKKSAGRMSSLISDVMDFARGRLRSGIEVSKREVADVAVRLTAVVQELKDANPERSIQMDISIARPLHCDINRIQQVVSNMVANALTHGSSESPVRVTASAGEHEWGFSVWNAGEPIPASSMSRLFEPFLDQPTPTVHQGLGLGLYICSQIVRAHEGQLRVTSTAEHGTEFTVRLPI